MRDALIRPIANAAAVAAMLVAAPAAAQEDTAAPPRATDTEYAAVVEQSVTAYIVPAYEALVDATHDLQMQVEAFCAGATAETRQTLEDALSGRSDADVFYYAFDLLYYEEWDLRAFPLVQRVVDHVVRHRHPEGDVGDHEGFLLHQTVDVVAIVDPELQERTREVRERAAAGDEALFVEHLHVGGVLGEGRMAGG